MAWEYQRTESENNFKPIPEGVHRVRVAEVEKAVSKNGNDMLKIKLDVSGYPGYLFHHIVFMPDRKDITNRMLTSFYDSFKDIKDGELDLSKWKGKVGACKVKHEEYNGEMQARVHYFVEANKQGDLPAWKEPERKGDGSSSSQVGNGDGKFVEVTDEEVESLGFF
jgi:hypothetical protein